MITPELAALLNWGVPKMTDAGRMRFDALMEKAVRSVVEQAFDKAELDAFHVSRMVQINSAPARSS